jgi:lipopolysaccharide transport system permease protein
MGEGTTSAVWPRAQAPAPDAQPAIVIEARPDTIGARLRALWRYRGFFGFLFREITMRKARGTLLGFWWLILRPLAAAAAFIFVFSSVRPMDTGGGVPYPVFFLAGYIPWRLFQSAMTSLPRTLMWTQNIMRRTYFPRLLVPLAGFGTTLIEFAILSVVFVGAATWLSLGDAPLPLRLGWETWWLLPALLAALLFALAFGLVFSVVALFFRDVVYSVRFVVQMLMFLTPVIYPVSFVPETYRWLLYALNPMAQVVVVSRWALTGEGPFELPFVLLSFATVLAVLAAGLAFFFRAETHLGDQL